MPEQMLRPRPTLMVVPTAEETGGPVADAVAGALANPEPVLGLATGSSPLPAYRELVRRHHEEGLSFAGSRAYLLDEYIGLPAGHRESYRSVIRREFTDHVDIADADVHSPDGTDPDPERAAAGYEQLLIAAGIVHVQVLGIGSNGHIGFNEPGSALDARTGVGVLSARTVRDNARFFTGEQEVPRRVITQGLGTILGAAHLVLVASGANKAAAVAAALDGPVTPRCPASVLQTHPRVTVVLDRAAAGGLRYGSTLRAAE